MALQFSTALRNARADRIESYVGSSAIMKIRTGSVPANCAAADSGTVLATLNLPGTVTATGGGGDMTLSSTSLVSGGSTTVTGFTITEGNS